VNGEVNRSRRTPLSAGGASISHIKGILPTCVGGMGGEGGGVKEKLVCVVLEGG